MNPFFLWNYANSFPSGKRKFIGTHKFCIFMRHAGAVMLYTLCVPCLLGLESIIANELKTLSFSDIRSENGRVYFSGSQEEIAKANLSLRCGERILLEVGRFDAFSFDELFEKTKALPWEDFIPVKGAFPVKGYSLNSKLFSVSDCQKIIKTAVVARLKSASTHPEPGSINGATGRHTTPLP